MMSKTLFALTAGLVWTAVAAPDEVRVSSFGFDAADSTRFLQAAINSGAKKVVVDKTPTPWITLPLKGASNQEIFFEPGAELVAKRGEYHDVRDTMFSFEDATNVTVVGYGAVLKMWAEDYMSKDYKVSEWRHAFSFLSCENVKILGLTIDGSGGDGIYLGSRKRERPACRDVVIRDVVAKRNVRQGISVISAENLLIENCKLIDTVGRPPESGIDFEPNQPHQRLVNVVMRNCEMTGNRGDGITISLQHFFRRTAPISLTIENCVTRDNEYAFRCSQNSRRGDFLQGFIKVRNCTFADSRLSAIHFLQKTGEAFPVTFENCRVENACRTQPELPDVTFDSRKRNDAPPDGIDFGNLEIVSPVVRAPFGFAQAGWCDEPVRAITGEVRRTDPSGTRTVALDAAWCAAFSPVRVGPLRPALALADAKVVDPAPDKMMKLSRMMLRGRAAYVFYADRAKTVRFVGSVKHIKPRRAPLSKVVVQAIGDAWKAEVAGAAAAGAFSFDVPKAGFYAMNVALGAQGFMLRSASVPVALWLCDDESQGVINSKGDLFVSVKEGEDLAFHVSGEGVVERAGAEAFDPSGKSAWKAPAALRWESFRKKAAAPGLWRICLQHPSAGSFEDVHFDLTAPSPLLFLTDKRTW